VLQLLGLKSFRTGAVMLAGLLLYDVFWVFGSPSVIGDNVMLTVATSDIVSGPTRLLFPRIAGGTGEASSFPFSLLGEQSPPSATCGTWREKYQTNKKQNKMRQPCQAFNEEKFEVILSWAQTSTQASTSHFQSAMSVPLGLLSAAFRLDAADVLTDSSITCYCAMCASMPVHWSAQQGWRENIKFDKVLELRSKLSWQQRIIGYHACCRSGGHRSARAVGLSGPEV